MQPIQVLLAEDNPADVEWLRMTLDDMGIPYSLTVAEDGEEALEYLLGRKPLNVADLDLIMLDINMPKLNGIEVLQAVPNTSKLPVCFVSGSQVQRNFVLKHFDLAVVSYLTKPLNREKLINCMRSYDHLKPVAERFQRRAAATSAPEG